VRAADDQPNDALVRRTREVWQPRLGRDLSDDQAQQIAASVTGFFAILAQWSRAEVPIPADDHTGIKDAA
jgi:hypothetical protein